MRSVWPGMLLFFALSLTSCQSSNSSAAAESAAAETACKKLFAKVDEICKAGEESPNCQGARALVMPIKEAEPDENTCKALMAPVEAAGKATEAPPADDPAPAGEEKDQESGSAPTE